MAADGAARGALSPPAAAATMDSGLWGRDNDRAEEGGKEEKGGAEGYGDHHEVVSHLGVLLVWYDFTQL